MTTTLNPPVHPLQPFDVLDTCHQQVVLTLQKLTELIDHIEAQGVDGQAQAWARDIFLFFMNTAREHHLDEERHIFPTMLSSGDASLMEAAMRLQQDHGWIEEDWLELAPQIESIAAGYNWFNLEQLRLAVPVFQALYQDTSRWKRPWPTRKPRRALPRGTCRAWAARWPRAAVRRAASLLEFAPQPNKQRSSTNRNARRLQRSPRVGCARGSSHRPI